MICKPAIAKDMISLYNKSEAVAKTFFSMKVSFSLWNRSRPCLISKDSKYSETGNLQIPSFCNGLRLRMVLMRLGKLQPQKSRRNPLKINKMKQK